MVKLLRSTFSTEQLKTIEGISDTDIRDAWTDAMSVFFRPDQHSDDRLIDMLGVSKDAHGAIDSFLFPGMMSINVAASGHRFSRTAQDIARDGLDGILLQFWQEGQLLVDKGNQTVGKGRAGDIHLVDFARETQAFTSDFNTYNLLIPREVLAGSVDLDYIHQKILSGDHATTRLLRRHLYELHREAEHMTAIEAHALIDPTIALIKATLTANADTTAEATEIIERNLLLEIKQFIDANLSNPKLSPDVIAVALGLSRSRLYRLAEPLGGIKTFIRNRRLRRAFQLLAVQGDEIQSIAALAYSQGFRSEDTFRRAFKNAFGMSPAEVKEQGVQAYSEYYSSAPKAKTSMPVGEHLYQKWVSDLFS